MNKKLLVIIIIAILGLFVAGFVYYKYNSEAYYYSGNAPEITEEDLYCGAYYGFKDQKKPGTPDDWVWNNAGRSSAWISPEDSKGVNCLDYDNSFKTKLDLELLEKSIIKIVEYCDELEKKSDGKTYNPTCYFKATNVSEYKKVYSEYELARSRYIVIEGDNRIILKVTIPLIFGSDTKTSGILAEFEFDKDKNLIDSIVQDNINTNL